MEEHMTTEEFAAEMRCPVSTVYYWRANKVGPVGFRVGKRVLYRRADVEAWLADLHARAVQAEVTA